MFQTGGGGGGEGRRERERQRVGERDRVQKTREERGVNGTGWREWGWGVGEEVGV